MKNKRPIIMRTPSDFSESQLMLLKKSMTKKKFKPYCQKYRNTSTLARNYGTRVIPSKLDRQNKQACRSTNMKELFSVERS